MASKDGLPRGIDWKDFSAGAVQAEGGKGKDQEGTNFSYTFEVHIIYMFDEIACVGHV